VGERASCTGKIRRNKIEWHLITLVGGRSSFKIEARHGGPTGLGRGRQPGATESTKDQGVLVSAKK